MEIQGILKNLREKNNLTQEQLAERVQVTRQAVSRWETGETQPNTDTLKLLSQVFDVSINTLLGSPRQLVCQCCGMPLNEDGLISREPDGSYNEDYCKWCYTDGKFAYQSKESLLNFLIKNMPMFWQEITSCFPVQIPLTGEDYCLRLFTTSHLMRVC